MFLLVLEFYLIIRVRFVGESFVCKKITKAAAKIKYNLQNQLELGNLYSNRDWGYAPEFIKFIWKILQQDNPDDFVLATNEIHSVGEFLEKAFEYSNLDFKKYIKYNESLLRPGEVPSLCGDASKAKNILGFNPKVKFNDIIKIMCDYDLREVQNEIIGVC